LLDEGEHPYDPSSFEDPDVSQASSSRSDHGQGRSSG
jgi:hypothetical protein